MKRMEIGLVGLMLLLILVHSDYTYSQTIAEKDLPYFIGKLRVLSSWGDTLDFTRFLEWRIDSQAYSDDWFRIESPDKDGCWIICTGKPVSCISYPELPAPDLKLQLMGVKWGFDLFSGRLLTVWETVGHDSVRFLCIDSAVSLSNIREIKQVLYFPDSSILLHCQSFECYHGSVSGSDQFFRTATGCKFKCIYGTSWRNFNPTKTYVLYNRLLRDRYRISEVTEYISYPDSKGPGVVLGGPNITYDGSVLDSARIRVIDLWELAKEKFGIDSLSSKQDMTSKPGH